MENPDSPDFQSPPKKSKNDSVELSSTISPTRMQDIGSDANMAVPTLFSPGRRQLTKKEKNLRAADDIDTLYVLYKTL